MLYNKYHIEKKQCTDTQKEEGTQNLHYVYGNFLQIDLDQNLGDE